MKPTPGQVVSKTINRKQCFTGVITIRKNGDLFNPLIILPSLKNVPFEKDDTLKCLNMENEPTIDERMVQ